MLATHINKSPAVNRINLIRTSTEFSETQASPDEQTINAEDRLAQEEKLRGIETDISEIQQQMEAVQWNMGSSRSLERKLDNLQIEHTNLSKHVQACLGKNSHQYHHKLMDVKIEIWEKITPTLTQQDHKFDKLKSIVKGLIEQNQTEFEELKKGNGEALARVRDDIRQNLRQSQRQQDERLGDVEIRSRYLKEDHSNFAKRLNRIEWQTKRDIDKIKADLSVTAEELDHFVTQQALQILSLRDEVNTLSGENRRLMAQQDELKASQTKQAEKLESMEAQVSVLNTEKAQVQDKLAQIGKQLQELLQAKDGVAQ